jgi:hypothetical protein
LKSKVHNNPSGDPKPSRDDIEMTREVKAAAEALGIAIHDHLVIGRKGHASFRSWACCLSALPVPLCKREATRKSHAEFDWEIVAKAGMHDHIPPWVDPTK